MLREHFSRYGTVVDCVAMNQGERPRGFGFVDFADAAAAHRAAQDTQVVDGRCIDVKPAMPRGQAGTHKIFVGGLTQNVDANMLRAHFGKFGQVMDVVVLVDRETNRSRGFGFIRFAKSFSVDWVIRNRDAHYIDGKWAEVKRAIPSDHLFGAETKEEDSWDDWEQWHSRCRDTDDWSSWELWAPRRAPCEREWSGWWGRGGWDDWSTSSWSRWEHERQVAAHAAAMSRPEYWLGRMISANVAMQTAVLAQVGPSAAALAEAFSPTSTPSAKRIDRTPSTAAETPSPSRSFVHDSPPKYYSLRKEVRPMSTLVEDEELVPSSS